VIKNPYIVLTEDMLKTLEEAANRGVEIYIGTNSPLSTDSSITQAFFLQDWPNVLARLGPKAHIFVATGERKQHSNVFMVDDEVRLVSTFNLDLLSGNIQGEDGALIRSKEFAASVLASVTSEKADPKNNVREYTIKRDAAGNAVFVDGKPVVEFGP